jgi:squalene-hopene/tetraprenyl-beta-curcumene cyclase
MRNRVVWIVLSGLLTGVLLSSFLSAQTNRGAAPAAGLSAETKASLQKALDKGVAYLLKNQKPNGSWEMHEGITGLTLIGLEELQTKAPANTASIDKGLKFLEGIVKPDGSIWTKDMAAVNTAISIMAMQASGRPQYKPTIKKAQDYLVKSQFDEGEGIKPTDKNYGGIGYDDESRADLSNLHHVLEALKETGLPAENAVWEKAIKFVDRTQNHKATNDQTWSTNDGGFIYMPGMSFSGGTQSYGSMTYAGLLSFSYANVKKTDARVADAYKWLTQHYTVDENPGMGKTTLYYYYMVFAKGLQAWGDPVVTDGKGVKHNWREDLAKKLIALQHPEGYWVNLDDPDHWQDNKVLVTAFTTIAINHILK